MPIDRRLTDAFGSAATKQLVDRLLLAWRQNPQFLEIGGEYQSIFGGEFVPARVKPFDSAIKKALALGKDAEDVPDLNRGVLLYDSLDDIRKFRTKISDIDSGLTYYLRIRSVRDRYAVQKTPDEFRGIFIRGALSLIGTLKNIPDFEIQAQMRSYWELTKPAHPLSKNIQAVSAQFGKGAQPPAIPEDVYQEKQIWIRERQLMLRQVAEESGVDALLVSKAGEKDCSRLVL